LTALVVVLSLAAACGAVLLAERRWRRVVRTELAEEKALGVVRSDDLQALATFRRFRGPWLADARERRRFRTLAVRLSRAKRAQRSAPEDQKRLLQIEVLTQRTRLRDIQKLLLERIRRQAEHEQGG
jgi:hypothetical protein